MDVGNTNRDMAISIAMRVAFHVRLMVPIVCQLDRAAVIIVAEVDEDDREASLLEIDSAQYFHAELAAVKVERLIEIAHTDHRVKNPRPVGVLAPDPILIIHAGDPLLSSRGGFYSASPRA